MMMMIYLCATVDVARDIKVGLELWIKPDVQQLFIPISISRLIHWPII